MSTRKEYDRILSNQKMEIGFTRLHKNLGICINNINIRKVGNSEIERIRNMLSEYGLVYFPSQSLSDLDLYQFSKLIGTGKLGETARKISQTSEIKYINNLSNLLDKDGNNIGHPGNTTDFWHSDQEFRLHPATLGLLYCVMPSLEGGATSFASTHISNTSIHADDIPHLGKLKTIYRPAETHDNIEHQEVIHPFINTTPSKKQFLYISENLDRFLGLSQSRSIELKKKLLADILQKENIYDHFWQVGDLLLYDNCQLIHRRNEFSGIRWLKSAKIYASKLFFSVPYGQVSENAKMLETHQECDAIARVAMSKTNSNAITFGTNEIEIRNIIHTSFEKYADMTELKVPNPIYIRAGKKGGLPFESLSTDLTLGCLPPHKICYGNCFAARAAFEAGFDFGTRVENILDVDLFKRDLSAMDDYQKYIRNGWNSDPSWAWQTALQLSELIAQSCRHTIFITKGFILPNNTLLAQFSDLKVELRVSISALDTSKQLEQRLTLVEEYRKHGGVAIPLLMTAKFKDTELQNKQDAIVNYLIDMDFPCAENSLRINSGSKILSLLDTSMMRPLTNGDLWAGRIYSSQKIKVPTTTSVPPNYMGLESGYLSKNDNEFLNSLWHDPVHTNYNVMLDQTNCQKPAKCGVPINWSECETNGLLSKNHNALPNQIQSMEANK